MAGKANVVIQLRLIVMVELVILSEFLNELLVELFILCLAARHVVSHSVSKSCLSIAYCDKCLELSVEICFSFYYNCSS